MPFLLELVFFWLLTFALIRGAIILVSRTVEFFWIRPQVAAWQEAFRHAEPAPIPLQGSTQLDFAQVLWDADDGEGTVTFRISFSVLEQDDPRWQATAHTLVVLLGAYHFCLDLAEAEEWEITRVVTEGALYGLPLHIDQLYEDGRMVALTDDDSPYGWGQRLLGDNPHERVRAFAFRAAVSFPFMPFVWWSVARLRDALLG